MFRRSLIPASLLVACSLLAQLTSAITVKGTILVLARSSNETYSPTAGLNAHGIPFEVVLVPQDGITLPTLNSSATVANYGGIITMSELSYDYSGTWRSALTDDQYNELFAYQAAFGVRMVRLDAFPESQFGMATVDPTGAGCCDAPTEQLLSFTDTSAFPTANLKTGATVSTEGLWHYPGKITNATLTTQIAKFAPDNSSLFTSDSVAAVINDFGDREQLVWFISWGNEWSQTSNFIQHAHINWLTRGLYVGRRRMFFNTQIDDMLLDTDIYEPNGTTFRIRISDLEAIVAWQTDINSRLTTGSNYKIEIGYNGNGDIETAVDINDDANGRRCTPDNGVDYDYPWADPPLEFQKPLGGGIDVWPTTPKNYTWAVTCAQLDTLTAWFMNTANRDQFCHISHTFTHLNLDNSTYSDTYKEIQFNQRWLTQVGIAAGCFTSNGIIPPAITGLHNGDAIHAWLDLGITQVVGDSSRPAIMNQENEHWPLISNVANNGYDGLVIVPRWPTAMYYNCYDGPCTSAEWVATSGGWGTFPDLLEFSRTTYTQQLLGLRHDSYMFHQANLRNGDTPAVSVGAQAGNLSLLQIWVELVTQEMMRLTTWPFVSVKQSDLAVQFTNRMAQDKCEPALSWTLADDGKSITGVTVSATNTACSVPIPVTFPVTATASCAGCTTSEQVGSDPLTLWTQLSGSPVSFTLSKAISI